MVISNEQAKKEEEERRDRWKKKDAKPEFEGNAAVDPSALWDTRRSLIPGVDEERLNKVFSRQDPEEEKIAQSSRIQTEMRELQLALQDRFEELFRLIEQMNVDRVNARNASQFLNDQTVSNKNPNLTQLSALAVEIQSHLSKGLVALIPELPQVSHFETNIVVLPIARTNIGSEEVGTSNSSFSVEVSSHESLGAAMADQAARNLLGSLSDLSTTVGFAIQGLMLADDGEAITMREELIMRQGQLKSVSEKIEEIINDVDGPLLMLFEAMDTQKGNAA